MWGKIIFRLYCVGGGVQLQTDAFPAPTLSRGTVRVGAPFSLHCNSSSSKSFQLTLLPRPYTSSDPWRVWSRALRQATERVWGGGPGTCLGVCLGRRTRWPLSGLCLCWLPQDGGRQWAFRKHGRGTGNTALPLHVQAQLYCSCCLPAESEPELPWAARPVGVTSAAVPTRVPAAQPSLGFPGRALDRCHTGQALCLGPLSPATSVPSLGSLPDTLQISADSALPSRTFLATKSLKHWPLYVVFCFRAVIQFMWAPSCA